MAYSPRAYKPKRHAVLDLETLHTAKNAAVVDIAIVIVDFNNPGIHGRQFHNSIKPSEYDALEGTGQFSRNEDTLNFHYKNDQLFLADCERLGVSIQEAAYAVNDFINEMSQEVELHLWSQGKDFDFPILENMLSQVGMGAPYAYSRVHCLRDLVWLNPASRIKSEGPVAHKALPDAMHEAKQLIATVNQSSWYQRLFK
jgi:hypothetical protein